MFLQCQACGGGRAIKKEGHNLNALPQHDPSIRESHLQRCREQWAKEADERQSDYELQKLQQGAEWFGKYNLYLNSEHWRQVRRRVLHRDPVCQHCFENSSQQAHHLSYRTYNTFGFSFPQECVGVCVGCHDQITDSGRGNE